MSTNLEELAKNLKALDEGIEIIAGLLGDASRSCVVEINNATSRPLRRLPQGRHSHGAFKTLPKEVIEPYSTDLFNSRSSELSAGTGTTGNVFYSVDNEGTVLHVRWVLPFIGTNETGMNATPPNGDMYAISHLVAGGSKKVPVRFIIGEKADLAEKHPGWRTCGQCKGLFLSSEDGHCPGEKRIDSISIATGRPVLTYGKHVGAGDTFQLQYNVNARGLNRESGWNKCGHCSASSTMDGRRRADVPASGADTWRKAAWISKWPMTCPRVQGNMDGVSARNAMFFSTNPTTPMETVLLAASMTHTLLTICWSVSRHPEGPRTS